MQGRHVCVYAHKQLPPRTGYSRHSTFHPQGSSPEEDKFIRQRWDSGDAGRGRSPFVTTPLSHGHKSQHLHSRSKHRGHSATPVGDRGVDRDLYGRGKKEVDGGWHRERDVRDVSYQDRRRDGGRGKERDGWEWGERYEDDHHSIRERDGDHIRRRDGGGDHISGREGAGHDHTSGRERDGVRAQMPAADGGRYQHGRDPLLVVNILKDGERREAIGGRKEGESKVPAKQKPHKNVYVLNQAEFTSSDSDLEADQLQVSRSVVIHTHHMVC